MKDEYDFSNSKRGVIVQKHFDAPTQNRVNVEVDREIVSRFLEMAESSGVSVAYQDLINSALRNYLDGQTARLDEETLRRIIREELKIQAA